MIDAARSALFVALLSLSTSCAASYCGDLENAYGPFDYRERAIHADSLKLVESAHFTPEVEKLISGNRGALGADLDYTLRAFPNHPRALTSMARLALRTKGSKSNGMKYSFECYFNRALRFQPDDPAVHAIYGGFLSKLGRLDEAIEHLSEAVRLQPNDATSNYNLALVYFDKKDYAKAREHAKKAYEQDFPLPGLKNKLIQAGKWEEAPAK
ncbi:tetratricopeptide repeat protein [Noviherbaspirillum denitrificans]|uniref:Uncharacterized protein n=1 Tax=Noviherbaspirillum denitrificans TaxID=1968433 RepID=A0A254TGH1_9BURK|nr:tetratricopeptide repeat protein [Noviherbaspirillum denitrificans]OWW20392.1 hypothetical protein AYR66_13755 [Noviherbaspirillum denitrificans]